MLCACNCLSIFYHIQTGSPQPRTEEDKLAGRMEVKRYKQTKEKLRRRREKLLQKVKMLTDRRRKDMKVAVI